jgi:hypothetical protein
MKVRTIWTRAIALSFHLATLSCHWLHAQTFQFLPEVDAYYRFTSNLRLEFQAKETREAGDPTQAEVGPSLDVFLKPLVRLKDISIFDPHETNSRLLQFFAGYRYVPSGDRSNIQRLQVGFISNLPLMGHVLLSDRNRADLDWSTGQFNWRYRNRVKFQRAFAIRSYRPAPYLAAEFFYQSQYGKWSTTSLFAGCLLPAGKHASLDAYYEHENVTGKHPNQQLDQVGLILNLYLGQHR